MKPALERYSAADNQIENGYRGYNIRSRSRAGESGLLENRGSKKLGVGAFSPGTPRKTGFSCTSPKRMTTGCRGIEQTMQAPTLVKE
jgi:hypothetical protein